MKKELADAIELRRKGESEKALDAFKGLLRSHPNDPDVNYQMAWTCDSLGKESEAVPFYEKAIANGLSEGRCEAYLGLGSTYRALGEYEKSLTVFDTAIREYPKDRALRVFRALTFYNLGRASESVGELLLHLLDTTGDDAIKKYEKALRFYSDKLDETWK